MEISVRDNRLRAALQDESVCKRRYGSDMAKKIKNRVATLYAAASLADFWPPKSGPERCHELQGDLAGTFSVDVKQPYRLLFVRFGRRLRLTVRMNGRVGPPLLQLKS